ncbi:hypothetical protein LUZ63_006858 [Rhynchospora breviuscula]|uniref:RING-type E3 ubiquitin transferase n=1 Tax=Rhynchospora breviuscula TaxID=2022672 RepID=A0A9Q0CQK3_9POAL|nr:hypothetical protein LUZ63_006858 [Rhynchospora breviuscula]
MEKMECQHSSAVAFVEGGHQDACEDGCSICLEPFSDSDPSTVTSCNHDFHLQCILEWCQRSSHCPMCWQPICLKDPTSQTLLEAVKSERNMTGNRFSEPVNLHPVLTDLEHGQWQANAESDELDEHLLQQLAAAAISDRAFEISEREILSNSYRPNNNTSSQAPVLPSNPIATSRSSRVIIGEVRQQVPPPQISPSDPAPVHTPMSLSTGASGSNPKGSGNRSVSGKPTSSNNETMGPSESQSFSESLKSRLNAVSSRYRESIKKNTRGWKERLFSRNATVSELGSEVKREVNYGIASVSRVVQSLETKDSSYVNEVRSNKNSADNLSNTNPNPSMRLHLARVAASDSLFSSPFLSNSGSSNACAASSSSK